MVMVAAAAGFGPGGRAFTADAGDDGKNGKGNEPPAPAKAKAAEEAPVRDGGDKASSSLEGPWCLLIEPRFMRNKAAKPVKDSQKTDIVAARISTFGPEVLQPEDFKELGLEWDAFAAKAAATATSHFKSLKTKIRIFRDSRGIAEYAVLETNDDPLVASSVFSPEFLQFFKKSFGDRFLVAIPDRTTIFVFPRGMDTFKEFGPDITNRYLSATYPCSLELLELDKTGLRAIGSFSDH